jgi:serine/threonine protein kinase
MSDLRPESHDQSAERSTDVYVKPNESSRVESKNVSSPYGAEGPVVPDYAKLVNGRPVLDGRYELTEMIGRGGQAQVWAAIDRIESAKRGVPCEVAVKIAFSSQHSKSQLAAIRNEVQKVTGLGNDRVLEVKDFGISDLNLNGTLVEAAWYSMRRLVGRTLADEIRVYNKKGSKMPWTLAFRYALEALEGLAFIHDKEHAHRDVKPSNLFITKDGNVMVLDLGLASLCTPLLGTAADGLFAGTPRYLPVEALALGQQYDRRWDLYALGATLAEMLTGVEPFPDVGRGLQFDALKKAHEETPVADRVARETSLPRVCAEIVAKATHRDPQQRYQSAREFEKALQNALSSANEYGIPEASVVDDEPKAVSGTNTDGRKRLPYLIVGALLALVLVGLGAFLMRRSGDPNPAVPAADFKGHLDFALTMRDGGPVFGAVLGDPKTPFLKIGDRGAVEIGLESGPKAFFYVIWIDSTGLAKPYFPDGWTWDHVPSQSTKDKVSTLRLPAVGEAPVGGTVAGRESILWLVRDTALTAEDNQKLKALLTAPALQWKQPDKDVTDEVIMIVDGKITKNRGGLQLQLAEVSAHPVRQTQAVMQEIHKQELARYTRAVCYRFVDK